MKIKSATEILYEALLKSQYAFVISYPNSTASTEIEIIKLVAQQITQKKRINITSKLDELENTEIEYEYLIYEARLVANAFHHPKDRGVLKAIAEMAKKTDSTPVYCLMYMGALLDAEKKYKEAYICYRKVIKKFPFYENARISASDNLCSQHNYKEAKEIILGGKRDFINWVNHKILHIFEYKLMIPVIVVVGLLMMWFSHSMIIFYSFFILSLTLGIWSWRKNQKLIIRVSRWLLALSAILLILASIPPFSGSIIK